PLLVAVSYCAPSPPPSATLSLHDSLPISRHRVRAAFVHRHDPEVDHVERATVAIEARGDRPLETARVQPGRGTVGVAAVHREVQDRKSTRLNSSHEWIAYAVFCLKKERQL